MSTLTGKRREDQRVAARRAFANEFARVFRNSGMAQAELGRLLGFRQTSVSSWLSGDNIPQHSTLYEIEQILGLLPGHLTRPFGCYPVAHLNRPTITVEEAVYADPTLDDLARRSIMAVYQVHSREPVVPRRAPAKKAAAAH